jgi:hypothetical protein
MMRKLISRATEKNLLVQKLYSVYVLRRQRRKVDAAVSELRAAGLRILEIDELYDRLAPHVQRTCHIIGAGWSVLSGVGKVKSDDFVIGMNFSGLCGIKHDLYFVEFGGSSIDAISLQQKRLIESLPLSNSATVIFKNLWEDKNEVSYLIKHWGDRVEYIRDIILPCRSEKFLSLVLRDLLTYDRKYLKQYSSTVLTAIALAAKVGFKKIVLHGIDFGGAYFFDLAEFDGNRDLRPPQNKDKNLYKTAGRSTVHSTSRGNIGVKASIPYIARLLADSGITLYSGTAQSPLAEILPVFDPL